MIYFPKRVKEPPKIEANENVEKNWLGSPFSFSITTLLRDTFSYVTKGPLEFMSIRLFMEGGKFSDAKLLQIAHRINIFTTNRAIIQWMMEVDRNGSQLSGGYQFNCPLSEMIGAHNPLTENNVDDHDDVKEFCIENQFNRVFLEKKRFVPMVFATREFFEENYAEPKEKVDFSWQIVKYCVSMAFRFILQVDFPVDEDFIQKMYHLEHRISGKMVYNPFTYIPDCIWARNFLGAKKMIQECVEALLEKDLLEKGDGLLSRMAKALKYSEKELQILEAVKNRELSFETLLKNRRLYRLFSEKLATYGLEKGCCIKEHLKEAFAIVEKMIQEAENGVKRFTVSQLASMAMTSIIIGSGAIRSTLVSALYLLVKNPHELNRLQKELQSFDYEIPSEEEYWQLEEKERTCLNKKLFKLFSACSLLQNVLKETYRLYPAVAVVARTSKVDLDFGDVKIKKGTQIYGSAYHMNRDAGCYEKTCESEECQNSAHRWIEPLKFDPDRFLNKETPFMAPFNLKNTLCVGNHFAAQEMMIYLVELLRTINIQYGYDEEVELEPLVGILTKFKEALLLDIEPIQN